MSRNDNVLIFEDTCKLCESNSQLVEAIANSKNKQYIVMESDEVNVSEEPRFTSPAKIVVSMKRSLEAASYYKDKKVCVHNFASSIVPGSGVRQGASGQEETLCCCSTLFLNLQEHDARFDFYGRHRSMLLKGSMDTTFNDDCIFTPDVVVFKSDDSTPKLLHESQWYNIDVITCAAPNLCELPSNSLNAIKKVNISEQNLKELHKKRLRRILDIAKAEKEDVVILGAYGCGSFLNSPHIVASAMNEVIKEYKYDFDTIEVAVFSTTNSIENYAVFNQVIERDKKLSGEK